MNNPESKLILLSESYESASGHVEEDTETWIELAEEASVRLVLEASQSNFIKGSSSKSRVVYVMSRSDLVELIRKHGTRMQD